MVLVIPSGIFWGSISVLGIYVFFSDAPGGIRGYPLLALSVLGLFSTAVAVHSVFRYPKVNKTTLIAYAAGSLALIAGAIAGLSENILYFLSTGSLVVAGALFTFQYIKNSKTFSPPL